MAPVQRSSVTELGWARARTVVLNLSIVSLQIQLLTHSMAQVYTRAQWDEEITQVSCIDNKRGFRVGIALDFDEYVLAFLSLDLIFTPHWFNTGKPLPVQHLDVYGDYAAWLSAVAEVVKLVHKQGWHKCRQLATTTIREIPSRKSQGHRHGRIFGGIGVYTVAEVFFLAGLSPFLTEGEVFSSPSRVARLCAAVWTIADRAHREVRGLLEPCFSGFVLAPTEQHRLQFSHWLYLHGKQHVYMPARMKTLYEAYEARLNELETQKAWRAGRMRGDAANEFALYDVFEPTYLRAALQQFPHLGDLVWGRSSELVSPEDSPLCALYCENAWWRSGATHLKSSFYAEDAQFLPVQEMRTARIETRLYLCGTIKSQKGVWSIVSPLPALPSKRGDVHGDFELASTSVRNARTFVEIVQSRSVAVGPLEYCAVGRRITRAGPHGRRNWQLVVCDESPVLDPHFRERQRAKTQMKKENRHKAGASHASSTKAHSRGGWQAPDFPSSRKRKAEVLQDLALSPQNGDELVVVVHPAKRRRQSADAKLCLGLTL
ncbi:hypothetical protein C8Q76DRAFT_53066 [Earliella scabrosa]|nr:hypothetical protein C8Q76DRAFT_53066 [Earliella scabrosa]